MVIVTLLDLIAFWVIHRMPALPARLSYLVGASSIAVISWLDDLQSISSQARFLVHSLGAALAIVGFGYWSHLDIPIVGEVSLGWLGVITTFVWTVGLSNAFNFMNGIDDLAGGQAAIAGLGWALPVG